MPSLRRELHRRGRRTALSIVRALRSDASRAGPNRSASERAARSAASHEPQRFRRLDATLVAVLRSAVPKRARVALAPRAWSQQTRGGRSVVEMVLALALMPVRWSCCLCVGAHAAVASGTFRKGGVRGSGVCNNRKRRWRCVGRWIVGAVARVPWPGGRTEIRPALKMKAQGRGEGRGEGPPSGADGSMLRPTPGCGGAGPSRRPRVRPPGDEPTARSHAGLGRTVSARRVAAPPQPFLSGEGGGEVTPATPATRCRHHRHQSGKGGGSASTGALAGSRAEGTRASR